MIGGWGAIADVIRRDVPLAVDDADIARRYQHHLVTASAPAAREVADLLAGCVRSSDNARVVSPAGIGGSDPSGPRVIDIGGGAGAYTHAVLAGDPSAHVTLVDGPEVVAIAREGLAEFGDRVRFIADDARTLQVGRYRDGDERGIHVAIVANVLHLHGAEACAQICASAARVLAPSGVVAVVDLRRGTLEGELFALNMAVYTDKGRVYADSQIASWLEHAGFVDVTVRALASAPEMTAVFATRPELG